MTRPIEIEFDAVQPDATRRWHRHQFGLRGVAWEVRGSFERVYFFDQDYVLGELSHLLQSTLVGLAAVIRSEIEAAVEQPMKPEHAATVNQFRTSASNWIGEPLKRGAS